MWRSGEQTSLAYSEREMTKVPSQGMKEGLREGMESIEIGEIGKVLPPRREMVKNPKKKKKEKRKKGNWRFPHLGEGSAFWFSRAVSDPFSGRLGRFDWSG